MVLPHPLQCASPPLSYTWLAWVFSSRDHLFDASPLLHPQGWNKMWDEWVEQTGLTKYKKELVAIEFKPDGDGGDGEPDGAAAAATNGAGGKAGGKKRKAEEMEAHANGTGLPAQVNGPAVQCGMPQGGSVAAAMRCARTMSHHPCQQPHRLTENVAGMLAQPAETQGCSTHMLLGQVGRSGRLLTTAMDVLRQVQVALPAALKQVLLDDWERVEGGSLAPLPRRPSVAALLQQYVDACRTSRELVEPEEEVLKQLDLQC